MLCPPGLLADGVPPPASPTPPTPPVQAADGPGGVKASHAAVIKTSYGEGGTQYWLYEPDQPKPATAPVIVFIHGWSAMNPAIYGAWIDHIVKRGNIVVFPRYQSTILTPPHNFTPNVIASIQDAIKRLKNDPGHVRPELDHVAAVGHSVGGLLVANVCALASESGLPPIRAVMSTEPGRTTTNQGDTFVELADMKKIPAETLLLAVAGDRDTLVGKTDALRIFRESVMVSPENKNFVLVVSDAHGTPSLIASHLAPVAPDLDYDTSQGSAIRRPLPRVRGVMIDAMDYYCFWKLFDGLCDAAFYGTDRQYALGNTPEQRYMGRWSDGTAVKELQITVGLPVTAAADPATPPAPTAAPR
jgi:acetyl esterase/lipase